MNFNKSEIIQTISRAKIQEIINTKPSTIDGYKYNIKNLFNRE